jgi:hypothetical protein
MLHNHANRSGRRNILPRAGFSYIAVMGVSLIVGTLALGGVSVLRIQARTSQDAISSLGARQNARTAAELARFLISNDISWRTTYSNGQLITNRATGTGTVTVTIQDPVDNNLANHPHDPLRLNITAVDRRATQRFQLDLEANPVPLRALAHGMHCWSGLNVQANGILQVYGGPVGVNGSLVNNNTIDGDVVATTISRQGIVTGTVTNSASVLSYPPQSVPTKYSEMGTQFTSGLNLIEKAVIAPGLNPFGQLNSGGVYIVRPTTNMTIRNTRIHGTLIVVMPNTSTRLTIEDNVFFQPAQPGYPALIVQGNLDLRYRSDGETLSESALSTNFNPAGAPYGNHTNTTTTDVYPSEIRGLVYCTRQLRWYNNGLLRGGVCVEGIGVTTGTEIHGTPRVLYDPYLFFSPGPWLTERVNLVPQLGTWKQVVQ